MQTTEPILSVSTVGGMWTPIQVMYTMIILCNYGLQLLGDSVLEAVFSRCKPRNQS